MATRIKKKDEKKDEGRIISGQKIVNLHCMGSQYDGGKFIVVIDDEHKDYRMDVHEFLKLTNGLKFKVKMAKLHEHLTIVTDEKEEVVSWSNEGDTVLDCFNGSGTTMKAAKLLKRNSIGVEIAKEYCELTVRRINKPMPLFNGLTS